MRRKDRELTDPAEIRAILEKAETCHLAMADSGVPYLVTMNFGIVGDRDPVLYFHSAGEGKKLEILKRNNVVCFAADIDRELLVSTSGTSCGCSMRYRSVTGMGCVTFVTGEAESARPWRRSCGTTASPRPIRSRRRWSGERQC